jgi:hypothetical protein
VVQVVLRHTTMLFHSVAVRPEQVGSPTCAAACPTGTAACLL